MTEREAFWSSSCPARRSDAVTYRHVQSPACIKSRATTDMLCPSLSYARGGRPCPPLPPTSEHAPATQLFDAYTANTLDTSRQSHWNVLNGTNVLTYVLFDRPSPRSRAGICATAIIRYRNIIQTSRFKHCKSGTRYFKLPLGLNQFPIFLK